MASLEKIKKTNINVFVILVFFILMSYRCYYYNGFNSFTKEMGGVALILLIYMFLVGFKKLFVSFFKIEALILLSTCVTMVFSMSHEGFNTFPGYMPYLSIVIIFYLFKKQPSLIFIEKVLFVLALLYVFCWLYQIIQMPEIIFGNPDRIGAGDEQRGFYRFYIETKEHMPFLVFYFLALYNDNKGKQYLLFALVFFIVVVFHVARQMIFWTAFFSVLYLMLSNKHRLKRSLFVMIVIVLFTYYFLLNLDVFKELIDLTLIKDTGINNADATNIRFSSFYFFLQDGCKDIMTFLFGNGIPLEGSALGKFLRSAQNMNFYLADVGFVALFWNFGFISLFLYLLLFYKILFKIKVHARYAYLKYYIAYILLSYIGSHSLTSNLVFVVLAIYILKYDYLRLNSSLKTQNVA